MGTGAFARTAWPDRARRRGTLGFGFRQRRRDLGRSDTARSLFASPFFYAGLLGSMLAWAVILALIV